MKIPLKMMLINIESNNYWFYKPSIYERSLFLSLLHSTQPYEATSVFISFCLSNYCGYFTFILHCLFIAKPFSSLLFSCYICSLGLLLSVFCHIKERQNNTKYFSIATIIIFHTDFAKHILAGFVHYASSDCVISSSS